ncbi:hypothetical protein MAPG_05475 [Magnaporthiopsis poae ATCC 64411]|uniref:Uncharacterized protein n=1 Tax=Magnaporthiopsis poae (strain ATCC 64411 / 73-15) TaxID=644358 RepID=A0A0C4DZH4_MAGP6|nr:hypothetical protein MAPG_05475 [Magnaporthiopsis poae ATCC 64411]
MTNSKGPIDWRNFTGIDMPKRAGDVIIVPITSFSPGVQQMGAKEYDDSMAFVKHDFEGEWSQDVLSRPSFDRSRHRLLLLLDPAYRHGLLYIFTKRHGQRKLPLRRTRETGFAKLSRSRPAPEVAGATDPRARLLSYSAFWLRHVLARLVV